MGIIVSVQKSDVRTAYLQFEYADSEVTYYKRQVERGRM